MGSARKATRVSAGIQRKIDIATAVGRERLFEAHLSHAVELIEHARKELAPPRAIDIYLRLHQLPPADAEILTHRVLVALGQLDDEATSADIAVEAERSEPVWQSVTPTLQWLQRRLRGRVHRELRQWVELHTARTEVALLKIHVRNAQEFIEILQPEVPLMSTVEMYVDAVRARPGLVETVYHLALNSMSEEGRIPMLPRGEPGSESGPPIRALPLRIVENTG